MLTGRDPNAPLSRLMLRHLGLKGEFAQQVRQARRIMPRAIWADAQFLTDLGGIKGNPRLSRQIDPARIAAARSNVLGWLEGPGPADWRKGRWISVALSFIVSLTLGFGLIIGLGLL